MSISHHNPDLSGPPASDLYNRDSKTTPLCLIKSDVFKVQNTVLHFLCVG